MKAYIAGPMRGYNKFNFPAFHEAEALARSLGLEVLNPARMDEELGFDPEKSLDEQPTFTMRDFVKRDLDCILSLTPGTDWIILLEGWEKSKGASAEHAVAKWLGVNAMPLVFLQQLHRNFPGVRFGNRN